MRGGKFSFIFLVGIFLLGCRPNEEAVFAPVPTVRSQDNIVTRVIVATGGDDDCLSESAVPVERQTDPLSGERPLSEYTLTGTVPISATAASAGFEVDLGLNCTGTADIILDSITYLESGQTNNNVTNSMFDSRLTGWHTWPVGSDAFSLIDSPTNSGQAIQVIVPVGKIFGINSDSFDVTPGREFTITFLANVSPASVGRGDFNIKFHGDFSNTFEAIFIVTTYPFEVR